MVSEDNPFDRNIRHCQEMCKWNQFCVVMNNSYTSLHLLQLCPRSLKADIDRNRMSFIQGPLCRPSDLISQLHLLFTGFNIVVFKGSNIGPEDPNILIHKHEVSVSPKIIKFLSLYHQLDISVFLRSQCSSK